MKKDKPTIGIAFWNYDLFPYLLFGEFTEYKGVTVYVPSYQGYFTPVFTIEKQKGSELAVDINDLAFKRQEAVKELNEKYNKELGNLLSEYGVRNILKR